MVTLVIFSFMGNRNPSLDPILSQFVGVHLLTFCLTKVRCNTKVHPLGKHGYVIPCIGNITAQKCCVCKFEFPIGVCIPEVR
jgi:hypothetical protein